MATREDDFDLDFDGFDDFDFGDPFGEGGTPKDDRNPTTKFVGGFLKGVQDTAKRPSTYVDVMRKALPDGYSSAYDVVEDAAGKGLGLYNEVVTDLRPAMRDLKRIMYRAKGAIDSVLPSSLSKKLDGWLKDKEQETRTSGNYDPTELKIASDLAEIFKVQAQDKDEDDRESLVKQIVEGKRHGTQTEQLDEIRLSLKQLANYQDTITYAFQRKALELQYRHFYASRDLLEVTKAGTQESITILRSIQKNSALPDIQKEYLGETASRLTKERLYGAVQESIAPYGGGFLGAVFENISKRVKEKTSEFTDLVSMTAMGLDQASEVGAMAEEFGESKEELAGKEAGKGITGWVARWLGKKLRPTFEKNPNIAAGGFKAGYLAENYDLLLKEKLEEYTPTNPIMQMLQESALEALRVKRGTKVGYDDISRATERAPWDNLQRKTLIEIIPGFLARLLQSSEGIRTGKEAPLAAYDHKTNRFTTVKALAQTIRTKAVDDYNLDRLSSRTSDVIDKIDPTKSIDDDLRKKLQLYLIKQAQQNKGFTPSSFTDDYKLLSGGFNYDEAEKIAEAVRTALDTDYDGNTAFTPEAQKAQRDIARDIRSIRELIPSVYEYANVNANTGNREAARLAGITRTVGDDDHVNDAFLLDKIKRHLEGVSDEDSTAEVLTDSIGVPPANNPRRTASFSRDTTNAILETLKATQSTNQTLVQEFKDSIQKSAEKYDTRTDFERLIQTIREESSKASALEASATLREILEIVDALRTQGVPTHSTGPAPDSPEAKNWRRLAKVGRGIRGAGKTLFKPVKGLWDLGGTMQRGIGGVLGSSWEGIKNVGSSLFNPIKERFQDVYVPGFAEPKLRAHLMAAGEYFDQKTNKAIKSLRDVKGTVVDKAGNVVLSAEEIKRGLMTADGKPIGARLLGSLMNAGLDVLGFAKRELGKGFALPFSLGSKAIGKLTSLLNKTPDVYVLGEGTPRLLGGLLRSGHYISAKTRKAITSVDQIDGDVLDGVTGEVVLRASDAAKGLVDRWGKPIRTVLGKVSDLVRKGIGLGKDALMWGGDQLLKGFGMVKDIAMGGLGGLKDVLSGIHVGSVKMDPVVDSVDRIYELLVKYFATRGMSEQDIEASGVFTPDTGDVDLREKPKSITDRVKEKAEALKERAGSWWNLKQGRGDRKDETTKEKPTQEKASKGNNWFSMLSMLLGGLGSSVVGAIKWLGGIIAGKAAIGALGDLGGLGGDGPDRKDKKGGRKGGAKGKGGLLRRAAGGLATAAWTGLKWGGRAALWAGIGTFKVGAALAGLATAPVILGTAAAALVGYAGYRAYRYFKDRLAPLQRVRFSQYGLPLTELDKCTIVGQLEMDAIRNVLWSDGKAVNIDSRFDLTTQLERFGIDPSDKRAVGNFATWYQNRFKPVYLTHLTVLSKLAPGLELHASDDLADYLKVTYVKATRYNADTPPQPYTVSVSPFPDTPLVHGREIIEYEIQQVLKENRDAKRPEVKAQKQAESTRPAIVPTALPTAGNALGTTTPSTRTEFVTQAAPATSPVGSMINPLSPRSQVAPNAAARSEFVTAPSSEETAFSLTQRPDPAKVGDQPRSDLYNSLPDPSGNGSWDAIKNTLIAAASAMGIDVRKLAMLAKLESSFDIYAKAKTSSARGLFQFISSTWRGLMDKYAGQFGIPRDAQPTDPKAASLLAAQFMKLNDTTLTKALGKVPDLTESYLAHFLGAGGSKTFLSADHSALAKDILPKAAAANRSIFFNRDNSPRTVGDVIDVMRKKVEGASTVVSTAPTTVSSATGAQANIAEGETFDDGRANRSPITQGPMGRSLLVPALPTAPAKLPASATTDGLTTPRPVAAPNPVETPAELERKELAKQVTRNRQMEQQQTTAAQTQREDVLAAIDLAAKSLRAQESMDNSLKIAVIHLSNLERLAKAEKPAVKVEEAKVSTLAATPVAPAPRAALSTARRYT